mmetsp:Transcript_32031/g.57424  ORF Transcript_32031/g.57424 Transcript_32031/m.57424 type:complete len:127 (-) Transcript_32031:40-420(-)
MYTSGAVHTCWHRSSYALLSRCSSPCSYLYLLLVLPKYSSQITPCGPEEGGCLSGDAEVALKERIKNIYRVAIQVHAKHTMEAFQCRMNNLLNPLVEQETRSRTACGAEKTGNKRERGDKRDEITI